MVFCRKTERQASHSILVMPIYNRLPHHLLPKLLTLCHRNIWGMACWRFLYNQHQNRNDSHYSHHGTRTQENDGRILHFPFEYMARSAKIKTKDSQDTRWRWMKESRQNFMTMALVQRSRQVSNSIYRAMFYGLLSERDTIKRWVPSHKTWSLTLIVLRFTETVSVSVLTTINILLCVKELERKLQSITENIYYTLVMWCFEVILGALISEHQ